MPRFLCFTLEGPLASWGDIAPGEQRTSWTRPSKSAALGLVAAALGIERTEETRLAALHEGLGFAVLAEQPGLPVTEFQTEQRPTSPGLNKFRKSNGRAPATRGESLEINDIATTTSRRSFHVGVRHRIGLWTRHAASFDLDAIARALKTPVYAPFLGRRAYSPSRPLAPLILETPTLEEALRLYQQADSALLKSQAREDNLGARRELPGPQTIKPALRPELWCDADPGPPLSGRIVETNIRRDSYRATGPRLFDERLEGRVDVVMSEIAPETVT
ncbi:MAG: type I-E CRISPR-associated protein Cas5/CasD [Alphaproteobacteria bacterium]|nr:type I-E CRISPR-associated protein Cas5/CasD [Alphaproteobacteria bacterium]